MRESLGTVRLHRWTCDGCSRVVENRSRASGRIPLPTGWLHVSLDVEVDERTKRIEADVCSTDCAGDVTRKAMEATTDAATP